MAAADAAVEKASKKKPYLHRTVFQLIKLQMLNHALLMSYS